MSDSNRRFTSRREFVKLAGSGAAAIAFALNMTGCDSTDPLGDDNPEPDVDSGISVSGNIITLDLTRNDTAGLQNPGGFLLIGSQHTAVINAGGTIRAFTSVCTHQACDVNRFENNKLMCPCHGSEFNTSGEAVTGPATGALAEFQVVRSGDQVTITTS